MQFDFIAMQNLYLSLARQDARPLIEALLSRPAVFPDSQWANFVRNHDELTLDDPRRIRMVYSLLFSLSGTPVLF